MLKYFIIILSFYYALCQSLGQFQYFVIPHISWEKVEKKKKYKHKDDIQEKLGKLGKLKKDRRNDAKSRNIRSKRA